MPVELQPVPRPLNLDRLLEVVAEAAEELNANAYLVGGFVRDRLLGRELGKDVDIVVVGGHGIPLLDAVARRLGWSRPAVFERFGTAQIRGGDFIVEVVQARSERYDPESRKPEVRPGSLEDDISRRDFTINALAQTLDGSVLDLTGHGLDDLTGGILRTPLAPAETFSEDPLRMFRAARFVAQLGFVLADGVLEAMRAMASRTAILSAERVRDEVRRLLVAAHPRQGMAVLRDSGLLAVALPELLPMVGVEQGGWHIHDVWDHTMYAVEAAPPDLVTRLGCLFHDAGKPATHAVAEDGRHTFYDHPKVGAEIAERVLTRLRLSHEEVEHVATLVRQHMWPIQYDPQVVGDNAVRRFIRAIGPLREQMLAVAHADTVASAYPDVDAIEELRRRMERLDAGASLSRFRPALDGNAIQTIAGRGPGPWIGRVHRALEDATLEGELEPGDAAAAKAWLLQHRELLAD